MYYLADERRLDEWIVRPSLGHALQRNLGVWVIVLVVVTHPHYLTVVGGGGGVAHLSSQEVGESLAGEPVDVVDGVALASQRVDEHSCSSCYSSLGNLLVIFINLSIKSLCQLNWLTKYHLFDKLIQIIKNVLTLSFMIIFF